METEGKVTSSLEILVKLKQGDALPRVFFNLGTEKYIRNITTGPGGTEF
jgi:hypothetical protein